MLGWLFDPYKIWNIKNVALYMKKYNIPYQSVTFDVTSEWLTNGISPESPITFEC